MIKLEILIDEISQDLEPALGVMENFALKYKEICSCQVIKTGRRQKTT